MSAAVAVRAWMMLRFWYGFDARAAQRRSTFVRPITTTTSTAARAAVEAQPARRRPVIRRVEKVLGTTRLTMRRTALADVHPWCQLSS